jgi:hypothetical protein
MAAAMNTASCNYEYMDEAKINGELKCAICQEPFQNPVHLSCEHAFCKQCIEAWLKFHTSCPTCRQSRRHHNTQTPLFSPVRTRIVINQLDQLLVRCKQCQQIDIQRGNFLDHQSKCTKMVVPCLSADIRCPWTGPRDEQAQHLITCYFHQLRPVLTSFQTELNKSNETQKRLEGELKRQSYEIAFLRAFINNGRVMTMECNKASNQCRYSKARKRNSRKKTFACILCRKAWRHEYVALHACSSDSPCDCICSKCHNQYSSLNDDDNHDDDEDDDNDDDDDDHDDDDDDD